METLLETEYLVARPKFKDRYDNFIGGEWIGPVKGEYFASISPIDGQPFTSVPRSGKEDIELALDAANKAFKTWSRTSPAERSNVLLKIAQGMEDTQNNLAAIDA